MLLAITTLAVITAPWVTPLYAGQGWTPRQIQVLAEFAYLCLPQIFFYGVYALYSQVLNTRGHFGAPMFAPIVNNVVVIVGCIVFIAVEHSPDIADISTGGILLLGIATTLGVVAQALVLVPVLARTGYRYRPRFDLRGQGLGRAVTLAKWTIFFVAVNQLAFLFVTRLANTAGAEQADLGRRGTQGLVRVRQRAPDVRPAALGHHGVGGDGADAPDEPVRARRRPRRAAARHLPRACG